MMPASMTAHAITKAQAPISVDSTTRSIGSRQSVTVSVPTIP